MFQSHPDCVGAQIGKSNVGDDGHCPQLVPVFPETLDERRDQVGRVGLLVAGVGCNHPLLADDVDDNCVRVEFPVLVELMLGKLQRGLEQTVEIVLRLLGDGDAPRSHVVGQLLWPLKAWWRTRAPERSARCWVSPCDLRPALRRAAKWVSIGVPPFGFVDDAE